MVYFFFLLFLYAEIQFGFGGGAQCKHSIGTTNKCHHHRQWFFFLATDISIKKFISNLIPVCSLPIINPE